MAKQIGWRDGKPWINQKLCIKMMVFSIFVFLVFSSFAVVLWKEEPKQRDLEHNTIGSLDEGQCAYFNTTVNGSSTFFRACIQNGQTYRKDLNLEEFLDGTKNNR